jgi:hypothetical protein
MDIATKTRSEISNLIYVTQKMLSVTILLYRLPNKHTLLLGRKPAAVEKTKHNLITFIL